MTETRECNGKARRVRIFAEYEKVLASIPKDDRQYRMKVIVGNVADTLGYSPQYVRKVINRIMKGK